MDGKSQSAKLVECSKSRKEWSETLHQTYFPGPFGVGKKRDLGNEVEISLAKSALHFVLSSLSSYVVCHTQSRKFSKVIHPSCGPTRVKDFPSFVNWELCICKKKKRPVCYFMEESVSYALTRVFFGLSTEWCDGDIAVQYSRKWHLNTGLLSNRLSLLQWVLFKPGSSSINQLCAFLVLDWD